MTPSSARRRLCVVGGCLWVALVWPACVWAQEPSSPAAAPCVMLSGGLGDDSPASVPDSPEALAARVWYDLDLQVTAHLERALLDKGYRVQLFQAPFEATPLQRQTIHRQWKASGCDWLVQVAHTAGEERGEAYFGYDFTVAALRGPSRLVESLYNLRPRFVRDRDNLLNFRAGEVIAPLVREIQVRRWLEPARGKAP